jgi:hypothetical protein
VAKKLDTLSAEILQSPLGQDPALEKFEEIFKKKKTGRLRLGDVDAFWDRAAQDEGAESIAPDVLSYEQAKKLGLLPPESDG